MRLAPVGKSVNQNRSGAGLGSGKGEGSGRGSGTGAGAGSGIGSGLGTRGSGAVIMVVASFRRLQAMFAFNALFFQGPSPEHPVALEVERVSRYEMR